MSGQRFFNHRDTQQEKQPPAQVAGGPHRRPANEQRGSDPYNTSGSFDRKKNWAKVGKR